MAASPVSQGIIHFTGSITEPSCVAQLLAGAVVDLQGCPSTSHGPNLDAKHVTPPLTVVAVGQTQVNVKLLPGSGRSERNYERQYQLVDEYDSPVRSGKYVVTMILP
ncbi:type 1 fimbrial protein [Pseudomonas sp. A1230]|uniref:type 1 fimbrial protein n=1 Tax=Pseudomonas sp. A1230 TaxID=3235106 RepID=UPI0037839C32